MTSFLIVWTIALFTIPKRGMVLLYSGCDINSVDISKGALGVCNPHGSHQVLSVFLGPSIYATIVSCNQQRGWKKEDVNRFCRPAVQIMRQRYTQGIPQLVLVSPWTSLPRPLALICYARAPEDVSVLFTFRTCGLQRSGSSQAISLQSRSPIHYGSPALLRIWLHISWGLCLPSVFFPLAMTCCYFLRMRTDHDYFQHGWWHGLHSGLS